ncbi:MAG: DUF5106 domain-containing protein [Bacteroidales bacterium]|nr:DUF5106 domain-containing protein [Candidatus Cacconaster merdequi]
MTKCHYIFLLIPVILLSGCCQRRDDKSLSEYSASSTAGRAYNFERYAFGLDSLPAEEALDRQRKRMMIDDSTLFQEELALQNHYFSNPNSPYRNEEYMIPVLESCIESPFASQQQKFEAQTNLPLFNLNRIGEEAADFSFTLRSGQTSSLSSIKADYIILFFSNPECGDCRRITELLSSDAALKQAQDNGKIVIVNIFPDDDIDIWLKCSADYPKEWVKGFAPGIDEPSAFGEQLYNLRAVPSLYLLDSEKRVVLKDAPPERILSRIFRR